MNDDIFRETTSDTGFGAGNDMNTPAAEVSDSTSAQSAAEESGSMNTAQEEPVQQENNTSGIPPYQSYQSAGAEQVHEDKPAQDDTSVFAEKDFRPKEYSTAQTYGQGFVPQYGDPMQYARPQGVPPYGYAQNVQNMPGPGQYGQPQPGVQDMRYNTPYSQAGMYNSVSGQNGVQYGAPQYGAPRYGQADNSGYAQRTPPQYNVPHYGYGYEQPPQPPLVPSVSEPAGKKNTSTAVMVIMAIIVVVLLSAVMIILAMRSKNSTGSALDPTSSGGPTENVTVNIEMDKRPAEDKSDYEDEEKGLFTVQGAVKYALPSVVSLYGYKEGTPAPVTSASGTVLSKDGYIVTNAHVVDDVDSLGVTLSDGTKYKAKIVAFDTKTDVAVIKVDADNLTPAVIGSADDLTQGDTVITIGNADGFENSVTTGIVSYTNRSISSYTGYDISCIQTDAALNHGQSGGAVIDLYGRVVGIVVSKYYSSETENLGFAIRSDEFVPVCEELIKKGYVSGRPRIGIIYTFVNADYASKNSLRPGIYVTEISSDCNIAESGLKVGDIITKIGDIEITAEGDVKKVQATYKPGDTVKAEVFRKDQFTNDEGEEIEIEFTFEEFKE